MTIAEKDRDTLTYDKRSKGDYSDYVTFDKNEVEVMHKEMQEFLKKIEEIISEKKPE